MKPFIAYLRLSQPRRRKDGSIIEDPFGLDAQRAAVRRYTQGATVAAEFVEIESGRNPDREQLRRAIGKARATRATLVVAKLDRLARDVRLILDLVDSGLQVHFCDLPALATDDPAVSRLLLTIMAAFAEFEARRIGQRTKDALAARKKRRAEAGLPPDPPKGFLRSDHPRRHYGTSEAIDARRRKARPYRAMMRQILRELERQGYATLRAKAEALNAQGFTTTGGRPWSAASVHKLARPCEWE